MLRIDKFKLFSLLPPAEQERLGAAAQERCYGAGQDVFREGDPGDGLYLVKAGLVQIIAPVGQEERHVICRLGPGEMFGEMAILDNQPRSATACAEVDTARCFIPRED